LKLDVKQTLGLDVNPTFQPKYDCPDVMLTYFVCSEVTK